MNIQIFRNKRQKRMIRHNAWFLDQAIISTMNLVFAIIYNFAIGFKGNSFGEKGE